jgi:hypothetical protein
MYFIATVPVDWQIEQDGRDEKDVFLVVLPSSHAGAD